MTWWTPYWFHVPRQWKSWLTCFGPGPTLRATTVALALFGILVAATKIAFPLLQLGFLWRAFTLIPMLFVMFFGMFLLHAAIPAQVEIRADRITVQEGQACWKCEADQLLSARLVVFAPDRIRLRLCYMHRGHFRSRCYGVASQVDLDSLAEMLPVELVVKDARGRYSQTSDCDARDNRSKNWNSWPKITAA